MKTKLNLLRATLCLAALLSLPASIALAQQASVRAAAKQPPAAAGDPVYDIEITDGILVYKGKKLPATLPHLIDLLRERHNGANIVVSPVISSDLRIDNLKLRATTLEQELEALRIASGGQFIWASQASPGQLDPTTGLASPRE